LYIILVGITTELAAVTKWKVAINLYLTVGQELALCHVQEFVTKQVVAEWA
jgi:p-aminobenzoyl-glutamate transporter AbgT